MRALLAGIALAACVGCGNGVQKMNENVPVCTTMAECSARDGERVHVVAVYTVWDPLPQRARNHPPAQQVMLVFGPEDEGPFLGAWGHEGHMRPLDEIARLDGKKVRVIGKFLREMPPHPTDPPEAASLAGPCIHPVEAITLVE
jgi:hypothetical protein